MKYLLICAAALALLVLLYIFLICPSGRKRRTEAFFKECKYYAHRGLHGNGVPENSLAAFGLACEAGYGIELDLHVTADGQVAVFHDNTLNRMCGIDGRIEDKTLEELRGICLANSKEHIPSFKEVLELVNGRVPLIIELKGEDLNVKVCELAAELLADYKGKWCVESFNPFHVRWWRKHQKNAVRGILSGGFEKSDKLIIKLRNFVLGNMLLNFLARPDFVAFDLRSKYKLSFRVARVLGGYPVAWTARGEEDMRITEGDFNAVIFEDLLP